MESANSAAPMAQAHVGLQGYEIDPAFLELSLAPTSEEPPTLVESGIRLDQPGACYPTRMEFHARRMPQFVAGVSGSGERGARIVHDSAD